MTQRAFPILGKKKAFPYVKMTSEQLSRKHLKKGLKQYRQRSKQTIKKVDKED